MRIDRIVVTGDTLRPSKRGEFGNQTGNILWLYHLIRHQLSRATGLPVEVSYKVDQKAFASQYSGLSEGVSVDTWAKLYDTASPHLETVWSHDFNNALVIGFELPPSLRNFLTASGIPFVDAMLHPVRFMDDLFLCFSSNRSDVEGCIRRFELSRQRVYDAAGVIQATVSRQTPLVEYEPSSVLYAAQTMIDRSMIVGGVFLHPEDVGELTASAVSNRPVIYKDHPFEKTPIIRRKIEAQCSSFSTTGENIYRLLCSPNIETVVSVSSSVGHEAIFFDKTANYIKSLSTPVRYADDPLDMGYSSVFDAFLGDVFWSDVLAPIMGKNMPSMLNCDVPYRPNFLRNSIGVYWGYDLFVCDPIIRNSNVNLSKDLPRTMRLLKLTESLLSTRHVIGAFQTMKAMKRLVR